MYSVLNAPEFFLFMSEGKKERTFQEINKKCIKF